MLLTVPVIAHAQSSDGTLGRSFDALSELGVEKLHAIHGSLRLHAWVRNDETSTIARFNPVSGQFET